MKIARVAIALLLGSSASLGAATPPPRVAAAAIDWAGFLAREDLVWSTNPTAWEDAAFIGNGNLGATIYEQDGRLAWEVNRADFAHHGSRYPMGHAMLLTTGKITGGDLRLDLWNAEARGTVRTDRGTIAWRSFTATNPSVIVIELEPSAGESDVRLGWAAADATAPDKVARKQRITAADREPAAIVHETAEGFTSAQPLHDHDAFAIVARRAAGASARRVYFLGIGSGPAAEPALASAAAPVTAALVQGLGRVGDAHRAWWHAYYPASFVSIPDARLEAFYWIQMYKLGAGMRGDGPILDLMGPWYRTSPWLRIWFNLNVQLTYSPLFTANRLALAESLFGALDRHRDALIANVPAALRPNAAVIGRSASYDLVRPIDLGAAQRSEAGSEAGNLPWMMYYYWEYARYQNDDVILRDRVIPLLRLAINHYLAYLEKGSDGRYHLPPTLSPELAIVPDCNYDLALLRWGCATLIESCERLQIADPLLPRWREVRANLTPAPIDQTGLMIGRDRPLRESHRHYSHLLGIYPLHVITPDTGQNRTLIETSLAHWTSMPAKFRGFSYTGAAAMHAELGHGDQAVDYLHQLLDRVIKPNTFYTEAGPVIETPLSGATSLQDMLLQSWGGKIRIFPAVPSAWSDTAFADLRAEGGYLVTAVRHDRRTAWVKIEYVGHGPPAAPCPVVVPGWSAAVVRSGPTAADAVGAIQNGEFTVRLAKAGAWVLLAPSAEAELPSLAPVAEPAGRENPYPQHYR